MLGGLYIRADMDSTKRATRIICYTRVSTPQQAGPTQTSLQQQREEINAYAEQHGFVVERVFTDIASGARIQNLKRLQEMLDYCERNPADGAGEVVVAMYDRIGRFKDIRTYLGRFKDIRTYRDIDRRLRSAGWTLKALDIDSSDVRPVAHILAGLLEESAAESPARMRTVEPLVEMFEDDPKGLFDFVKGALGKAIDALPEISEDES